MQIEEIFNLTVSRIVMGYADQYGGRYPTGMVEDVRSLMRQVHEDYYTVDQFRHILTGWYLAKGLDIVTAMDAASEIATQWDSDWESWNKANL